jgi:O-antigen/teichoic acid export membrane protein
MTFVILCGVDNVLTPQAAHAYASGGVRDLKRVLVLTALFLFVVLGGMCVVVFLSGDWLMVFAFGSQYQGTRAILTALALSTLMTGLGLVAGNGLWAIDEPRSNFVADVCCIAITLVLGGLLIIPLGALGAAISTLAGTTTAAIVRTAILIRRLEHAQRYHR